MVKLSIIIPTYNEDKYLPSLLDSIKKQDYNDYEVIIADGGSEDETVKIAENGGVKVIDGLDHPGKGRNAGAKVANGEILLFLDADVILPDSFIKESLDEFEKRFLSIASVNQIPQIPSLRNKVYHSAYNSIIGALQYVYPGAQGVCLFATKRLHKRIKGFDEKLKLGEDADYVLRASKLAKYRKLTTEVYVSTRRIDKEKISTLLAKYAKCEVNRVLKQHEKINEIEYKFGSH